MDIPQNKFTAACVAVEQSHQLQLPFRCRGIRIDEELIATTLAILNAEPNRTLAQHSANAVAAKTKDGLDLRLKQQLGNLRRANIISDVLAKAEIVDVISVTSPVTGHTVKGTRSRPEWTW